LAGARDRSRPGRQSARSAGSQRFQKCADPPRFGASRPHRRREEIFDLESKPYVC